MKDLKRVLAIEDDKDLLETYSDIISEEGYQVDIAENLDTAVSKIRCNTYHVAIVDLQLDNFDDSNRDGVKIIKYFHELNEGTQTVVVSGQDTPEVFVEIYEAYGITQYLIKKPTTSPNEIVSAVDSAYNKCVIREFGASDSITKFLSGGKNVLQWEHKCLSLLQPSGGVNGLYSFLKDLITPYTPLLPIQDAIVPMDIDTNDQCLKGEFWSKGIGMPISISIYPQRKQYESDFLKADEQLLKKYNESNMVGLVFNLLDGKREMFVERL